MRSTDHAAPRRPMPMFLALLAALALALAACTSETGATAEASASAAESAAESMAESAQESAEPSAEESATASEDGGEATHVTLSGFAFQPTQLTVSVGDTVRFINEDGAPHTVTEGTDGNADADAAFNEQVSAGEWIEVTFDEAGDINVTCLFHSNMNMVVHVE
jgi:plastocyanin